MSKECGEEDDGEKKGAGGGANDRDIRVRNDTTLHPWPAASCVDGLGLARSALICQL